MLETTTATTFVPGTNLKGQVAGANWSFLLPSLELRRILHVGLPSQPALTTLARLSSEVLVLCSTPKQVHMLNVLRQPAELAHVQPLIAKNWNELPLVERSVDLLVINSPTYPQPMAHLLRLLAEDGTVVFPNGNPQLSSTFAGNLQQFWLTPLQGEMQTAVPIQDQQTIDYFLRNSLYSNSIKLRPFKRLERVINARIARLQRRKGAIAAQPAVGLDQGPPRYLRQLAAQSGLTIDAYRWGLAAHGEYTSRKVLFFLFAPGSKTPTAIVKMTRAPELNRRLENEQRALTMLQQRGLSDPEVLPQVLFAGHHGNLAIVGESIVEGVPFRQRTDHSANCRYLHAAIDWLTDLASATAEHHHATPLQVSETLEGLFRRFCEIYEITPGHRALLLEQLRIIAGSQQSFPLVFQHGDPGTWNLFATPNGKAAFLDWEAFEQYGMPLWDLFYLMRSYSVGTARKAGINDSLKGFEQQWMSDTPLNAYLVGAVRRYCAQISLAPALVEPLLYTCWMHRSLKEATRLPTRRLEQGHYVNLLRLCLDRRTVPAFARLFSFDG